MIGGGALVGALVLAAWLPVGALISQREAISAANARLAQLTAEGRTLSAEMQQLHSPQFKLQLFREKYQLVKPGQRLIQVATPSSSTYSGDPGYAPFVDPVTGSLIPTTPSASRSTAPGSSFLSRVLGTLEFWR